MTKKNVIKKSVSILPDHYDAAVREAKREGHGCISRILQDAMRLYIAFHATRKISDIRKKLKALRCPEKTCTGCSRKSRTNAAHQTNCEK